MRGKKEEALEEDMLIAKEMECEQGVKAEMITTDRRKLGSKGKKRRAVNAGNIETN